MSVPVPFSLPEELVAAGRKARESAALDTITSELDRTVKSGMSGLEHAAGVVAEPFKPLAAALGTGLSVPSLEDLTPDWIKDQQAKASQLTQQASSFAQSAASGITVPTLDDLTPEWMRPAPAAPTSPPAASTRLSGPPAGRLGPSLTSGPPPSTGGPSGTGETPNEYLRTAALAKGIDPQQVLAVMGKEGPTGWGSVGTFNTGTSYGPLQLHYAGGSNPKQGMGDRFTAATGIDLRKDSSVTAHQRAVDFALDELAKRGDWSEWYGADNAFPVSAGGKGRFTPVGRVAPVAPAAAAPAARQPALTSGPVPSAPAAPSAGLQGITPPQFGLGDADADAICGPVLALAFAKSNGRNPTIAEAKQMAATHGRWTSAAGMGGPEAMAQTLRAMDIPAHYAAGPLDLDTIRREVTNGNPVGINTSGHYFVVEGVDDQGRLDLGNSAKALRASGGRQWFRPEEIQGLGMGAPTGAIYKDSPSSPTPSVAAATTQMPTVSRQDAPVQRFSTRQADTRMALAPGLMSDADVGMGTQAAPAPAPPARDDYKTESPVPFDPDQGPRELGYALPPEPAPAAPGFGQSILDAGSSAISSAVDTAGRAVGAVTDAAGRAGQAISDAYAVPTEQRPPQYSGPSYAQPTREERGLPPISVPDRAAEIWEDPLTQAGVQTASTMIGLTPPTTAQDVAMQAAPAPARLGTAISQLGSGIGSAIGRRGAEEQFGTDPVFTTPEIPTPFGTIPGIPVTPGGIGEVVGGALGDPTTYVGGGALGRAADAPIEAATKAVGRAVAAPFRGMQGALRPGVRGVTDALAAEAPGVQRLGSGVVPDPEAPRRMYHGTAEAFARPDPAKFAADGLYGPGYYLTDNPTVASSYASMRNTTPGGITPKPILRANRLNDEIRSLDYQLSRNPTPEDRAWLEGRLSDAHAELDRVTTQGPNVRAIDVPEGLNLLDADAPVPERLLYPANQLRAADSLPPLETGLTGSQFYEAVREAYPTGSKRAVNEFLARRGIDGIRHTGGQIMGLLDDAGRPIEHQVTVVFPDALDKIRNAFSGESGGSGVVPRLGAGVRAPLYNAAQGGVLGAGSEVLQAQEEGRDVDPAEMARRALIGGGLAVAGGSRAGRRLAGQAAEALGSGVVPGSGQVGRAAQSPNPHIANTARQMAGEYTPSGVDKRPLLERIASALTDRHAIVGNVEQEIKGRISDAGGTAPATRLAERIRENPNSIAAQRATEELAPAIQSVGEDTDWLEQILVHAHNADVAASKGTEAYDAAIAAGRTPQAAQKIADRVQQSRMFSGGMTEADVVQAISDIQTQIGPARYQKVLQAAQAFWDTGRTSLDEKLAEGMISPALHQELTTRYPHYVRTDIADYFEGGPAAPSPGGKTLGISNVGIKAISPTGTTKDRVNPVLSTIDALYSHEAAVTRNRAGQDLVTLRDADQQARELFKEVAPDQKAFRANRTEMVPSDYSLRNGEQKLTVWENGEARQFIIPAEYSQLLSPRQGALLGDSAGAQGLRNFFGLWKSLITTHNPAFQMVVSPIRDAGDYAVGEATRSASKGGVRGMAQAVGAVPGVVADYLKALPAAFEGLGKGQVGQEVADLRRAGAGFEGRPARTDAGLRQVYSDLQSSGGMAIRSPQDALRAARTVLTLGAEPIGSRLEMVPRVAAARRAAGRGADELGQAMAFKDATIDFNRGGWLTQQLNAVVPFINPTMQSAAQVGRLAKKNPAAFTAAVASGVGVPAMLAEAWNRSDEQRAADYANVPDSVKNTGIVWMLPDEAAGQQIAGSTELGERKPNYLWVPLGSFAFAARMAREGLALADPVTGLHPGPERPGRRIDSPADAALHALEIGTDILASFSPVKGDNISSSVASLVPPVASEALEIGVNKDLYRGTTIATDRRDELASNLSKGIAGGINAVGDTDAVRPSQVEHVVRGVGGYAGQLAAAASDLGRDRGETRPIQDIPVTGGLASRIVRDTGGQRQEDAESTAVRVPIGVRSVLREAGMRSDQVQPVGATYLGGPLTRGEQLAWQQATNDLLEQYVTDAASSSKWDDPTTREAAVSAAMTKARAEAAKQAELPSRSEMRERAQQRQQRRAG